MPTWTLKAGEHCWTCYGTQRTNHYEWNNLIAPWKIQINNFNSTFTHQDWKPFLYTTWGTSWTLVKVPSLINHSNPLSLNHRLKLPVVSIPAIRYILKYVSYSFINTVFRMEGKKAFSASFGLGPQSNIHLDILISQKINFVISHRMFNADIVGMSVPQKSTHIHSNSTMTFISVEI